MRFLVAGFVVFLLVIESASADDRSKQGDLTIKDVWSRATLTRNGVVYMKIFNHGNRTDRLIAAESSLAKKVELHMHSIKDGVMRMRRVTAVEVQPRESAVLAPGGSHVMLMGLRRSLNEGDTFLVALVFEKAGKVMVDVTVKKAGAMGHGDHKMGGHFSHKHNN